MSVNEQNNSQENPADAFRAAAQQAAQEVLDEEKVEEVQPEVVESITQAQWEEAQAKLAETKDLYVRTVAEMENVRRRCAEDVQKAQKFGIEKFAKNLLPVVDSLDKALESTQDQKGAMREGIESVFKQLMHALEVSGMTSIDPKGEKFDPNEHQAIAMVPAAEGQVTGTVAAVLQRGWKLQDRVIRAAMVTVVQ